MTSDPRATSALCAALADLAEEARLPRTLVARITSAIMDLCHGQRAHVQRLQRRLRRQDNALELLVRRVEAQQNTIAQLEKQCSQMHRGHCGEEEGVERSGVQRNSMGGSPVEKNDVAIASSGEGIVHGRTDSQSSGKDALKGLSEESKVVEWVFHASYPLSSSNPMDLNSSKETVHPSTAGQSCLRGSVSDASPNETYGCRTSMSGDIVLAIARDAEKKNDRRGNDRCVSSSGTKLDQYVANEGNASAETLNFPSDSSKRHTDKSDEQVRPVSPAEELRPLPSLDDVLREARRQRLHRRAQKRQRDRDFMTPCEECCVAQRVKLTDENGRVNEKKYERFVTKPGACHHFRHLDESVDSVERDKWHDLSFAETKTESPDEEIQDIL